MADMRLFHSSFLLVTLIFKLLVLDYHLPTQYHPSPFYILYKTVEESEKQNFLESFFLESGLVSQEEEIPRDLEGITKEGCILFFSGNSKLTFEQR